MNIAPISDPVSTAPAARVVETFTAAIVADRIRAAVDAVHFAAKAELEAFKAGPLKESNAGNAKLRATIADLESKLKQSEELSAAHLGVHPLAGEAIAGRGAPRASPAAIFAEWRSLVGPARSDFYSRNETAIWRAQIETSIS